MKEQSREARLESVYGAKSVEELGRSYDDWAESYDDDVFSFGYLSPSVAAALAARHIPTGGGPVLDAGAGTGIMGEILSVLGYDELEALDLSAGMLKVAERRGVYTKLHQASMSDPLDLADDRYAGVVAVGVLTVGHVGPEALDEMIRVTKPGGAIVFTVTKPVYEESFRPKQEALQREGRWRLLEASGEFVALPKEDGAFPAICFAYQVA